MPAVFDTTIFGYTDFMRVLHTSDLHLGRALFGVKRDETFGKFLDWLKDTIDEQKIEALIIAGDIFDSATPSHLAQEQYFRFLSRLINHPTCRHTIVVGGNHDSASLLNAPQEIMARLNIHIVGCACDDPKDEVVVLKDKSGKPEAVVLAVPYLRERDVRVSHEQESQSDKEALIVEGTRKHYTEVLEVALNRLKELGATDIPVIATGHLFAAKCSAGDDERNLYVGSLGQIPADVFDNRIDYVALGHLHRPQLVGGNPTRRYSGSPLALDFSENHAKKSVLIVDFEGKTPSVTELPVPAFDRLERVSGTEEEIFQKLSVLVSQNQPLFCEITHSQGAFAPQLAQDCRDIAQGSAVQIVRVVSRAVINAQITAQDRITDIDTLTPEEMFELRLSKESELDDAAKSLLRNAHAEILHAYYNPDVDRTEEKKE